MDPRTCSVTLKIITLARPRRGEPQDVLGEANITFTGNDSLLTLRATVNGEMEKALSAGNKSSYLILLGELAKPDFTANNLEKAVAQYNDVSGIEFTEEELGQLQRTASALRLYVANNLPASTQAKEWQIILNALDVQASLLNHVKTDLVHTDEDTFSKGLSFVDVMRAYWALLNHVDEISNLKKDGEWDVEACHSATTKIEQLRRLWLRLNIAINTAATFLDHVTNAQVKTAVFGLLADVNTDSRNIGEGRELLMHSHYISHQLVRRVCLACLRQSMNGRKNICLLCTKGGGRAADFSL